MRDIILKLPQQLKTELETYDLDKLPISNQSFLLVGMGGSHLAGDLLKNIKPEVDLFIHSDYDLPLKIKNDQLIIIASYSGNTTETLSALAKAEKQNLPVVIITAGGQLWIEAETKNHPRIKIPNPQIPPRMALGYFLIALAIIINDTILKSDLKITADKLKPQDFEIEAQTITEIINPGSTVLCYTSTANSSLALNWKIKLNETGKISSFYNVFPELNHNEIVSLDAWPKNFITLIVKDEKDDQRIAKRMDIFTKLLTDRNLKSIDINLKGNTRLEKMFNCLILADWTAYHLAQKQNLDPASTPIIEEFKKLIN